MSLPGDESRLEVLLLPSADDAHCELLTMLAHYHRTLRQFGHRHLIPFGRPWLPGSALDCGLFSLPYLDGPALEWLCPANSDESEHIQFLWLIPITHDERVYCRENGLEALETLFESTRFNYADPGRPSVVPVPPRHPRIPRLPRPAHDLNPSPPPPAGHPCHPLKP